MLPTFTYVRPRTLKEAMRHLEGADARVSAGGTDLLGCLRDGVFTATKVVTLGPLAELRGVSATPSGGVRIGALTPIAEVATNAGIRAHYAALAQAAAAVASPQLRNQGTLGGNLCQKPRCWYYRGDFHCLRKGGDTCYAYGGENQLHCIFGGESCFMVHPSDTAPALVALGAEVRIAGPRGRRRVPVERFHVPPSVDPRRETVLERDEIVTDVVLPPAAGMRSSYRKVAARAAWDFALAAIALAVRFEGEIVREAHVVLGAAAAVPWRAVGVERVLVGRALDAGAVTEAAAAVVAGAESLTGNAYKLPLFRGVLAEQLEAIARG